MKRAIKKIGSWTEFICGVWSFRVDPKKAECSISGRRLARHDRNSHPPPIIHGTSAPGQNKSASCRSAPPAASSNTLSSSTRCHPLLLWITGSGRAIRVGHGCGGRFGPDPLDAFHTLIGATPPTKNMPKRPPTDLTDVFFGRPMGPSTRISPRN